METRIICTADGSTSYYLSKEIGETLQEIIEKDGIEKTISKCDGLELGTIHINHGMGETFTVDDKLSQMYSIEIAGVEDRDEQDRKRIDMFDAVLEVVQSQHPYSHEQVMTYDDIWLSQWHDRDNELYDVVGVGEDAMKGFMREMIYNDKEKLRSRCKAYVYEKMEQYLQEKGMELTEEQKEHIYNRGWSCKISLVTWTGQGEYVYEKDKQRQKMSQR